MLPNHPIPLAKAAKRVGRSERTLWRWQARGLIVILPGGFVLERDLLNAERLIRQSRLVEREKRLLRERNGVA